MFNLTANLTKDGLQLWNDIEIIEETHLVLSLIIILGFQVIFFLLSGICNLEKIKDVTGGLTFITIALMTFFLAQTFHIRQILVTSFICIWAARLAIYLSWRTSHAILNESPNPLTINDENKWPRLVVFWAFQAVWIFTMSIPVILINAQKSTPIRNQSELDQFTEIDILGIVMWTVGFLLEFFADIQKFRFRQKPSNEEKFCTDGLWTWSRHPNYAGEILLWWGIFAIYTQTTSETWFIGIASPLFITFILLFVSGILPLEQSADLRYSNNPKYREYKYGTSPLIPMPPELYIKFPRWIKFLLFELPIYDNIPETEKPHEKTGKTAPVTTRRLEMPY